MANGGIIGPVKVVCTPSTKTTTFTSSGTFQKKNCTSTIPEIMVVAGGGLIFLLLEKDCIQELKGQNILIFLNGMTEDENGFKEIM